MGCDQALKVCHLISGDLWAGAEVQVFTMLNSLKTLHRLELSAIVLNEGTLATKLREIGLPVYVCEESRLSFRELYSRIRQILQKNPVDILHSHRIKENVLASLLKRNGVVKHIVSTVHGMPETFVLKSRLKRAVYGTLENFFAKRYGDMILPVSHDIENVMIKRFGVAKVNIVHNAIDMDRIKVTRPADTIRKELNISLVQRVIGTAGRMVPVKGYDLFLQAAVMILESKPDTKFVIAGDGPLLADLKQMAISMGISEQVIFTGFREDILDVINSFDFFLMSSHHEGIPMVVLEAMSLGKTVVAFDVGGLREIIQNDCSGLLVEPENPFALARACVTIMNDDARKCKMESAAMQHIRTNFATEAQRNLLLDLYNQVNSVS
jgi:L-malate glycosyltransferase